MSKKDFIKVWLEAYRKGESQNWIGRQLGVSRQYVSSHATNLRLKGVKLPKLNRGYTQLGYRRNKINVEEANKKIEEEVGEV